MNCKFPFRRWMCGLALLLMVAPVAPGGTFGKVVDIGGHASDIALDEARGVLYIANFTAKRIEVMSLADYSIQRSMNVAAQPGSLALSPDGRYLVATHYGNFTAPGSPNNAMTVIDLTTNARQTFSVGSPALGVAFGIDGRALVVTSTEFILFDPATGMTDVIDTISGAVAKALPQPAGTPPSKIVATSLAVSGDGVVIYGLSDSFIFRYDSVRKHLRSAGYTSSPTLGPRAVSVNRDGSMFIGGWVLRDQDMRTISQFPNVSGALEIGTVLFDSQRNLIYAQMGPTEASTPVLQIVESDNLQVRDRMNLPENLSGKSVLSGDGSVMYAVSESGVVVLPVGATNRMPRVFASKQDVVFRGSYCDRNVATQEVTIQSEGAAVDFKMTSDNPAVRMTPSSGTTPAVVRISVDPASFSTQKGSATANLKIESSRAVNQAAPIRVVVNSREPDQRGVLVNVPGTLVDVIADPSSDRFFILRQSTNEVLVFDGTTFTQTAALRTYNTPKSMTITFDRRYLLVGCDNAQLINVFDLETLQADRPIRTIDYVQSIAASANAILASMRSSTGGDAKIHRVDLASRTTAPLETLGVFENKIAQDTVLTASPNGKTILVAQADGNIMLYDGVQDTFTVSRKESPALTGAYAASSFDKYVVGNVLLNSSLVPERRFETETGKSAGFAFLDRDLGFRLTAPSSSAPGVITRMDLASGFGIRPTRTIEAPVLAGTGTAFTRTLAPMASRSAIVALTTSGFTILPWNYDAATAPPRIERIVNAADMAQPVAPGGLIAVLGSELSPVTQASSQIPLPTALGETCLTVNGTPVPMMLVSPQRINAQLPLAAEGNTTLVLRTPGGVSDNYNVSILPAAPSVFRTGTAGPETGLPTIVRDRNNEIVTLSNPVHHGDVLIIYATGLGATSPVVEAGLPAPSDQLASVVIPPEVSLGGVPVEVLFAGLTPEQVGIYQINVRVNSRVPLGMSVPLLIQQGTSATSLPVRVVE